MQNFIIKLADDTDFKFAEAISAEIERSAKERGIGIAKRSPEYIIEKMKAGKAFVAISENTNDIAGFCYIETFDNDEFVGNSGLIVFPQYRRDGVASQLKYFIFEETLKRYPNSKIMSLTTSLPVMKLNSELGYKPVTYNLMPKEDRFWNKCQSCINYQTLM